VATCFHKGFEIEPKAIIWRFTSFKYLLEMIEKGEVYFPSARQFNDPWEGSLAIPDSSLGQSTMDRSVLHIVARGLEEQRFSRAFEQLCRLTKIHCWQIADEEIPAMWARYGREIATVAMRSTVGGLMRGLKDFRLQPQFGCEDVHVGAVRYIHFERERMQDRSASGRFFHKDVSFSYERELRAVVSLRSSEEFGVDVPEKGVMVPVDLKEVIDSVRVSPLAPNRLLTQLKEIVTAAGLPWDVDFSRCLRAFS
jgi:hypothetical protein